MKRITPIFLFAFVSIWPPALAVDNCNIEIMILPERYMSGTITETNNVKNNKNTHVVFSNTDMKIMFRNKEKAYIITVLNQDCQAYCRKQKRIRQLHSGDEAIVINLIKQRKDEILRQYQDCSMK